MLCFSRHAADLVLQGHEHDYERSWPTAKGQPTQKDYSSPTAPVYVVNGAGGNREKNDHPPGDQPWAPKAAEVGHGFTPQSRNVSFAIITISGDVLSYEQIDSESGSTIDAFKITK